MQESNHSRHISDDMNEMIVDKGKGERGSGHYIFWGVKIGWVCLFNYRYASQYRRFQVNFVWLDPSAFLRGKPRDEIMCSLWPVLHTRTLVDILKRI